MNALPGGISSLIRRLPDVDGKPFRVRRAFGPWLEDEDGKVYVDHALAMGATMLGHAHPAIVEACRVALEEGAMPGFSHAREAQAAEELVALLPGFERATFVTTGSEAVHLACRIARRSTGRPVIAKIAGGFDGWYDDLALGWSGSPEADLAGGRPLANGMTLVRFNDLHDLEALFAERKDVAAILVEPMLANSGSLRASPDFFRALGEIARRHGAMVISDEVLMGFRLRCGPSCREVGLEPDLVTLGKAVGSGIPVAAVLGTREAFAAVEDGRANRAGTYHGNPLATAAVLATLAVLRQEDYGALLARGDRLRQEIVAAFAREGVAASTSGYGTVFSVWFSAEPPASYAEAKALLRPEASALLHVEMRRHGAVIIPGGWGRLFVSFAHDEAALERTATAFRASAGPVARILGARA